MVKSAVAVSNDIMSSLVEIVGKDYVTNDPLVCYPYKRDQGIMTKGRVPEMVVKPHNVEEIRAVLLLANEHRIPIYTRGTYTSPFGYYPVKGGMVMDFTRMNRILDLNEESLTVVVEPGITFGELDKAVNSQNYEILCAPAGALGGTVGGHVSSGGSSAHCIMIGGQGECVMGLRVALPDGRLVATGTAANPATHSHFARYSHMLDMTGLFVGAEGTLGVIYEIALKIEETPEAAGFAAYAYDTIDAACKALYLARKKRIPAKIVQLADGKSNDLVDPATPHPTVQVMWIRIGGSQVVVDDALRQLNDINKSVGAKPLGPKPAEKYWRDRYRAMAGFLYRHGARLSYHILAPIGELATFYKNIRALADQLMEKYDVKVIFSWHPCDRACLTTVTTFCEEDDAVSWQKAVDVWKELKDPLLDMGGCFYRVGYDYSGDQMYRLGDHYELIKDIRKTIDPNGILNPGFGYML